jgi:hypothetical protein
MTGKPERTYRLRAVERGNPDVQRLLEVMIRLAIQRRELARVTQQAAPLAPSGRRS